jgi:hypothetical protein
LKNFLRRAYRRSGLPSQKLPILTEPDVENADENNDNDDEIA